MFTFNCKMKSIVFRLLDKSKFIAILPSLFNLTLFIDGLKEIYEVHEIFTQSYITNA